MRSLCCARVQAGAAPLSGGGIVGLLETISRSTFDLRAVLQTLVMATSLGSDFRASAGTALDHHRWTTGGTDLLSRHACHHVGRTTRWERHNQSGRSAGLGPHWREGEHTDECDDRERDGQTS
jgi:hypothetical protein